ncbi:MAG: prepilin-type N-terminal cleavage/methylation domain-containing protein [Kiritimatiellia bacterium]|jgi:prepilin-type N-terminal cleavage/methylation domain-containing protein
MSSSPRRGFTLIEILLVVIIVGMVSGIAGVQFANSMKGARLRASARVIVAMNKYARSMAVLSQKHMVLMYDSNVNKMELVTLGRSSDARQSDRFDRFGGGSGDPDEGLYDEDGELTETGMQVEQTNRKMRRLEEGITIIDFEVDIDDLYETDGVYWVNYYSNGMCDAHRFALVDPRGHRVDIKVESITGELSVEYQDF